MLKDQGEEFILSAAGMMCDVKIFPGRCLLCRKSCSNADVLFFKATRLWVCAHIMWSWWSCAAFIMPHGAFWLQRIIKPACCRARSRETLAHFSVLYIWFTRTHALSVHVKCIVDWNWNTATSSILPPPPCAVLNNASAHPGELYWCLI